MAYVASTDLIPWFGRTHLDGHELTLERDVEESGNLYVVRQLPGRDPVTLNTAWLMEREQPYQMGVELARGRVNQVRNVLFDWRQQGVDPPAEMLSRLRESREWFGRAVTCQSRPDEASEFATRSTLAAVEAADQLCDAFLYHSISNRRKQNGKLGTFLGADLGPRPLEVEAARPYLSAFNTGWVPLGWRSVERVEGSRDWSLSDVQVDWCRKNGLRICCGPLVSGEDASLPDWLTLWHGDLEGLANLAGDHVRAVVRRYRGQVNLWEVAARFNGSPSLGLNEDQWLQLVVHLVAAARDEDPRTPVTVRLDQPWAEYMGREFHELSPLHFADAMIRAEIGLSGIGLELNWGFGYGSLPRDRLAVNRLVDLWSCLGLPIYLAVCLPSDSSSDPRARRRALEGAAGTEGWTAERQRAWVERWIPFLISKPSIHGLLWSQWSDAVEHDHPHGGLLDGAGIVKPACQALAEARGEHLI